MELLSEVHTTAQVLNCALSRERERTGEPERNPPFVSAELEYSSERYNEQEYTPHIANSTTKHPAIKQNERTMLEKWRQLHCRTYESVHGKTSRM